MDGPGSNRGKPIRLTPAAEGDRLMREHIERHYVDRETGELVTPEDFIARSEWTFAKSMPHLPHEYAVKGKTAPGGAVFEWFVGLTRELGERRTFGRRVYAYLAVGEHEYWAMSPPEIADVINRQRVEDRPTKPAQKSEAGGSGQVPAQLPLLPDDEDENRDRCPHTPTTDQQGGHRAKDD